ncbi:MAG: MBL fold metallo-hydrolase [Acetobacteraceae bacterium]|nr:MBL fold metallo-hydrolase [Acetobacteraceae bacterium]
MSLSNLRPEVEGFHDKDTGTVTYVVADPSTGRAAIIDPVLDYDPKAARTSTRSADAVIARVKEHSLAIDWLLETHVHADHLSGLGYVKRALGGRTGIGARIGTVQEVFKDIFGFEREFQPDGSQFDHLFEDDENFTLGNIRARVLHTPGHTPACVSYLIGDAVFVGDTLFMPDGGTARADFPGGDAVTLYRSIHRILDLPPATRMFICHDYSPGGRPPAWETTVAEQREKNIHIHDGIDEAAYVALRTSRDKTLSMPVLIIPSVQVNIRAGELPETAPNGIRYLRIPLNVL